ncbi:hypothetical protein [Streptomyces sp. NPDC005953]|uniref:hypothetical protein n=1 Tax=Streptomyces sp. NPDC005953 TaxID=3156719 RepID=UPI0033EB2326
MAFSPDEEVLAVADGAGRHMNGGDAAAGPRGAGKPTPSPPHGPHSRGQQLPLDL